MSFFLFSLAISSLIKYYSFSHWRFAFFSPYFTSCSCFISLNRKTPVLKLVIAILEFGKEAVQESYRADVLLHNEKRLMLNDCTLTPCLRSTGREKRPPLRCSRGLSNGGRDRRFGKHVFLPFFLTPIPSFPDSLFCPFWPFSLSAFPASPIFPVRQH